MRHQPLRLAPATSGGAGAAAATVASGSLLGYPIRRAAASELLYGGVRIRHLVQPAFALQKIRSEDLPPPSLQRERGDLRLEMQLPRDFHHYNNVNTAIQRQLGGSGGPDSPGESGHDGFNMGEFYSSVHHPERQYTSSLPYSVHDTNNVLALRLFPVNIGIRVRTEAIRLRTEDCLRRLEDSKLCAECGQRTQYPLSLAARQRLREQQAHGKQQETLYSHPRADSTATPHEQPPRAEAERAHRLAHLRGAAYHPRPSELSIVTRAVDLVQLPDPATGNLPRTTTTSTLSSSSMPSRVWRPLQMLKPIGHQWSPAARSSGLRGPNAQLAQERLDQKGFGWKRKSRSLWQQDTATAGFRPHRYF